MAAVVRTLCAYRGRQTRLEYYTLHTFTGQNMGLASSSRG